jgi:FtsZ-binding cell division protein ZapB
VLDIWRSTSFGTNHGAIDNRIEQAMDLVKSHLMNAVRSEVEELKEKIIRLEDTIINLQSENEVLKRNVPNDVLRQISNTTTPLLAVQQQQIASTTYSTIAVNPNMQQQPSSALPLASTGVTSTLQAPMNTANLGTTLVINSSNLPNANSGVIQGLTNINTSSQIPPTYMPQATGTQAPPVTPKPPQ